MEKEVKGTEVQVALQGTLETFALADVLRLLASTKKTGTLRIDGDRGTGQMTVVDGELVGASAARAPLAERPAEVLFELLRYETGSFIFDSESEVAAGPHNDSVEEALADAEEQLREWREIEAVVPSPTRMINLVADRGGKDITLSAKQWSAVVALGPGCTPQALGERLGLPELPATRLVRDLVELGAVEVGEETEGYERPRPRDDTPPVAESAPAPEPAPAPAPAPVESVASVEPETNDTIVLDSAPEPEPQPEPPAPAAFEPQIVPPPPTTPPPPPPAPPSGSSGGSTSFADAPSFLSHEEAAPPPPPPSAPPNNGGPLFTPNESANSAFAPPEGAFALAPQNDSPSAFAPAPSPGAPSDGWNDDSDDGLSSFHTDDDAPLFGESNDSPGPDDPFGPDPFQIPSFTGSAKDAQEAEDAAAMARQLANLSPRAQQAVAAAAAASTDEERDQAITKAEQASDEPINRNLLLKYLSSVDE